MNFRAEPTAAHEAILNRCRWLVIGTGISLISTGAAAALLLGLKQNDPLTLVLAGLALATVAAEASCLPVFRARASIRQKP